MTCDYPHLHPVIIMQDRYRDVYSGGSWLAIANYCGDRPQQVADGPDCGDIEARAFWFEPPQWIAAGDSPQQALDALIAKNPGKRLEV